MPFRLILEPPPTLMSGLRQAPQIIRKELLRGMGRAVGMSAQAVRNQILATTDVDTGSLSKGVRRRVDEEGGGRLVGRVGMGKPGRDRAFYAPTVNRGGTLTARSGGMMAIPMTPAARRQQEEWYRGAGRGNRTLKAYADELRFVKGRSSLFLISKTNSDIRFVLKRSVTIRGRNFFAPGMQAASGQAKAVLEAAYRRALKRIPKGGAG